VVSASLSVARPEETPTNQEVNVELDAQRNRIETAEAMEHASRLADAGNLDGGREIFKAMKRKIAESASASHALSANLSAECEQLETQYRSMSAYRDVGSKMSKMGYRSHCVQRSNHMNADAYRSGASAKAKMKSSWMASIKSSGPAGDSDSD